MSDDLHPVYLPLTEEQLIGHFAPVGTTKRSPDRHLDYFPKSLQAARDYAAFQHSGTPAEEVKAKAHGLQMQKDERFWAVTALLSIFGAPYRGSVPGGRRLHSRRHRNHLRPALEWHHLAAAVTPRHCVTPQLRATQSRQGPTSDAITRPDRYPTGQGDDGLDLRTERAVRIGHRSARRLLAQSLRRARAEVPSMRGESTGGKKSDRLPVRVAEHNAVLPSGDGEEVSETYTLATTLLDHDRVSAGQVREAYLMRWPASETTFGENKTTITGAGNRTSGPVLRSGTPRLIIQEFWAWMTGTQLVRASAAASLAGDAAAARALRREEAKPVTTDEVSFAVTRHNAIRSMTQAKVTASASLAALAAVADATSRATLHTLITVNRQRHSQRAQKARPRFPHAAATKKTVTGVPEVTRFQPGTG